MKKCLCIHTTHNYYRFIIDDDDTKIDIIATNLKKCSWDKILRMETYTYSKLDSTNLPFPETFIKKITI